MAGRSEIESLLNRHGLYCAKVRLSVLSVDAKRTVCDAWPGPVGQDQRLDVLEAVEERALRQANLLGGVHTFMLELLDGEGNTQVSELFRVSAEAMPGMAASVATEPPNEAGHLAQMMRHNESYYRVSLMAWQNGATAQEKAIATLQRRNEMLEQRLFDQLELVRDAVMGQREHELAVIKATASAEAKGALVKQVVNLLPEAASAIVSKVTKAPQASALIGLKGFLGSIRNEQMMAIMAALDPEQQLTLVNTMKRLAEQEKPPEPPPTEKVNGKTPH